jgi:hypothetical protein
MPLSGDLDAGIIIGALAGSVTYRFVFTEANEVNEGLGANILCLLRYLLFKSMIDER